MFKKTIIHIILSVLAVLWAIIGLEPFLEYFPKYLLVIVQFLFLEIHLASFFLVFAFHSFARFSSRWLNSQYRRELNQADTLAIIGIEQN